MARKKMTTPLRSTKPPDGYGEFLDSLKTRVRSSQTRAMLSVNRELVALYWDIGRQIVLRQEQEGWGKGVVDRLAADIQKEFPGIRGFSEVNIGRMRAFFLAYRGVTAISSQAVTKSASPAAVPNLSQAVTDLTAVPKPFASIPWGHNQFLLFKLKDPAERLWYAAKTLEHGWSRAVLTVQIESDLHSRQGEAVSNFAADLGDRQRVWIPLRSRCSVSISSNPARKR